MKKLILTVFFIFLSINPAISQDNNNLCLTLQLSEYFENYYRSISENTAPIPQEKLISDIKRLLIQRGYADEQLVNASGIEDLERSINKILIDDQSIIFFTVPQSEIVNCWLGTLFEEKKEIRNIWGKEIEFVVRVMYNLQVKDLAYYLSAGKEALDAGERGGIIYYNAEAYKNRVDTIWGFFVERDKGRVDKRYDPSKSNRLRKFLYYKAWVNLYAESVKNSQNLEEAKAKFVNEAIGLLKENSLYHEIGHIFAERYLGLNDELKEEKVAFLSELRYGALPYESLETLIAASYQSSMSYYNLAGRQIIYAFISYINNEQKNKNPKYKNIDLRGRSQVEKTNNLYRLSEDEIRLISGHIFKGQTGWLD